MNNYELHCFLICTIKMTKSNVNLINSCFFRIAIFLNRWLNEQKTR